MSGKILDSTMGALNTSLNLRSMNQNIISSNIANADTPNYKSKSIDFEDAFRAALGTGDELTMEKASPDHMVPSEQDPVNPEIFEETNDVHSLDGNTVDRSAEMAKLAENEALYDASAEMLRKKLGMLKYSIAEGGGGQ